MSACKTTAEQPPSCLPPDLPPYQHRVEVEACVRNEAARVYLQKLQEAVLDAWELPAGAAPDQCSSVEFSVRGDGELAAKPLSLSASTPELGASTVLAFDAAGPFPAVPNSAACLIGLSLRATFWNPED